MTCEELRDEYELHALGLDDDPERGELLAHLARGCPACGAGVRQARGLLAMLATTAPAVAPRPTLRRRILASAGVFPRRAPAWIPLWVAACVACLVVAFYFYGRNRDNELLVGRFQEQVRRQAIDLARTNDALALLNRQDTRQVSFGAGGAQPPRGRVFVNPKLGVLLLASNLPPAPAGRIYEMWILPKSGQPVPAGLFDADTQGAAFHLQPISVDLAATAAVAVTLEAAGGAAQPTTQPVIVAAL